VVAATEELETEEVTINAPDRKKQSQSVDECQVEEWKHTLLMSTMP
jgi:hypothetical protein